MDALRLSISVVFFADPSISEGSLPSVGSPSFLILKMLCFIVRFKFHKKVQLQKQFKDNCISFVAFSTLILANDKGKYKFRPYNAFDQGNAQFQKKQQVQNQGRSMQRHLEIITNCDKYSVSRSSSKKANLLVSMLDVDSYLKIPTLNEIIESWNTQNQATGKQADYLRVPKFSCIEQLDGYVQSLTSKITSLESVLKELSKRHMEVCVILQKQVQRRDSRVDLLAKQNSDLKRELNEMIQEVKMIASRLGYKSEEKNSYRSTSKSLKNRLKNKENEFSGTREMRCVTNLGELELKSLPRTQLSKVKLKTANSELKFKEQFTEPSKRREKTKKLRLIKEEYYEKYDHRMKIRDVGGPNTVKRGAFSPLSIQKHKDV